MRALLIKGAARALSLPSQLLNHSRMSQLACDVAVYRSLRHAPLVCRCRLVPEHASWSRRADLAPDAGGRERVPDGFHERLLAFLAC